MADKLKWTITKPPSPLNYHIEIIPKDSEFFRVHKSKYTSLQFNPGFGDARFSPIKDKNGAQIPTIYAGSNLRVAFMESVFHDIPFTSGLKSFDTSKLDGEAVSKIKLLRDLKLVKLSSPASRKLGISDAELIHSLPDIYPQTRAWGEAIHTAAGDADGLVWTSRQAADGTAIVLFGDRVFTSDFYTLIESRALSVKSIYYNTLKELADEMGVYLTY